MQAKSMLDKLIKSTTVLMNTFNLENQQIQDDYTAGLAEIEMEFIDNEIQDSETYFIGRFKKFQLPTENHASTIGRHVAEKIGIKYGNRSIKLSKTSDDNYVNVFLSGRAIHEYLKPQIAKPRSSTSYFIDDFCNQINLVMNTFGNGSEQDERNAEQINGLNQFINYASTKNKSNNTDSRFFIGRFSIQTTSTQFFVDANSIESTRMALLSAHIAKQIGLGLSAEDIEIEQSNNPQFVKVYLKSAVMNKCQLESGQGNFCSNNNN